MLLIIRSANKVAWVNHPGTVPELLFIRRSPSHSPNGGSHRWSSHIAFPGGRHEASDESALYTALRETWEEIGVDLAEREFVQVGRLDEREITTSLGKRLLMILSPFGEFFSFMKLYQLTWQCFCRHHRLAQNRNYNRQKSRRFTGYRSQR